MKRIGKVIVASILAIMLLAGCTMKAEYGVVVSDKGNVKIEITSAMDDEMIDAMINMGNMNMTEDQSTSTTQQQTHTDEERWAYVESGITQDDSYTGMTKTKYDKDGFKGYTFSKDMGHIDSISTSDSSEKADLNGNMQESKLFQKDGTKYKSLLYMSADSEDQQQMTQAEQYGAIVNIEFKLTLPVKPISNNATSVSEDGKTLTWDLTKERNIEVEFDLGSSKNSGSTTTDSEKGNNTLLYVGIGIVAAVVIIAVVLVVTKKSKNTVAPVQPVEPVTPVTPVTPEVAPTQDVVQATPDVVSVEPVQTTPDVPTVDATPESTTPTDNSQNV